MNNEKYVRDLIASELAAGIDPQLVAWHAALACVGWAYVFGARGEYCEPSNRRSRARDDHPTIKSACKNFSGSDKVPEKCVGCKWYLGPKEYDASDPHKGRTRFFDCRGYTYWILKQVYGFTLQGGGATSQWNTGSNWSSKGTVKDGVPENTLVCLFVKKGNVMEHTGFGFNGETLECSAGVQHFTKMNKKWTHWGVPACVEGGTAVSNPTNNVIVTYPTVRKGNKGEVVTQLQSFLALDGSQLTVDGIFGNGTLAAVKAFQKRHGLVVDGIVGPKTWAKLLEVAGNIKIPESDEAATDDPYNRLHTLIIPNLTEEEALDLTCKFHQAVPVEYEDVAPYIEAQQ